MYCIASFADSPGAARARNQMLAKLHQTSTRSRRGSARPRARNASRAVRASHRAFRGTNLAPPGSIQYGRAADRAGHEPPVNLADDRA
jgi:hypothetical protein